MDKHLSNQTTTDIQMMNGVLSERLCSLLVLHFIDTKLIVFNSSDRKGPFRVTNEMQHFSAETPAM